MTKDEFIAYLAKRMETDNEQAAWAFKHVIEGFKDILKKGETLMIPGFGTFSVIRRPERMGRNPKTGEPLQICAKATPKFAPGDALKLHVSSWLRDR